MIRRPLCAVLLALAALPASAAEFIASFHSDIEVRRNGDLQVTETIVVRAEGKSIRRGIYRDFPTRYRDARGNNVVVGFDLVAARRDGVAEPYHIKHRANGVRVYLGSERVFLEPGFYEYELSYVTTRQLGFFDDFDELYWNVTGNGWEFRIDAASATVSLPDTVSDFRLTGYTGHQGSSAQDLVYRRVGNNRVFFESTRGLGPREGLTIVAGWPKGIVDQPSAAQRRSWFLQDHSATLFILGGALTLLAYYFVVWHRIGRDPESGVIIPHYRPADGYSPASMRFVERMGYDKKCFTAAVVNLAVKHVIEINDDDGDFELLKKDTADAPLAAGEAQVLKGLFGRVRQQLSISQSNHDILSHAIGRHRGSLELDYARKYFNTNRGWSIAGILISLVIIGAAVATLPSEEIILKTLFLTLFLLAPIIILFSAVRAVIRRGRKGIVRYGIFIVVLLVFIGVFYSGLPLLDMLDGVSLPLVTGLASILLMHYLFYQWMKAPTLAGRRLLDQVEGFRHYLSVAEEDELKLVDAPTFSQDLYEAYLPYAIALDLENEWTQRLSRAVAAGLVDPAYREPDWYHSRSRGRQHFSNALSNSLDSAIASSSVAPGSSSGSSGGFSGGGGGGGGGGGW